MRLTGEKKIRNIFSSTFSFLRAFVVSSCRKSGFQVLLSVRYGADMGRSGVFVHLVNVRIVCEHASHLKGYKRYDFEWRSAPFPDL